MNYLLRVRKPRFSESALNLPYAYGLREEGEFFAIENMCAFKKAKKREKTPLCRQVSPFSLDNLFYQLKTNCENNYTLNLNSTTSPSFIT